MVNMVATPYGICNTSLEYTDNYVTTVAISMESNLAMAYRVYYTSLTYADSEVFVIVY
jgi:hypothetical protein